MMGLTVHQPWASLIAMGYKRYEFRSWEAWGSVQGQRIAIQAATRKVKAKEVHDILRRLDDEKSFLDPACRELLEERILDHYPRSCLVATARLGTPLQPEALAQMCNDADRPEHYRWAWPLTDVVQLPCIPHRGAQGFWTVSPSIAREIA